MTETAEHLVFIEHTDGQVADVSLELTGKARDLAGQLGLRVAGLLCGHGVEELARDVIRHGADRVLLAGPSRARVLPHAFPTRASRSPRRAGAGRRFSSSAGTPTAGTSRRRVASALRCGLTADCTDLQIGDYYLRRQDTTFRNLLYQIRPAFGGNLVATIRHPDHAARWQRFARGGHAHAGCRCRAGPGSWRAVTPSSSRATSPSRS